MEIILYVLEENTKKQAKLARSNVIKARKIVKFINAGYFAKYQASYYMYKISNVNKVLAIYGLNANRSIIAWSVTRIAEFTNKSRIHEEKSKEYFLKAASYETNTSDFIPDVNVYQAAVDKYKLAFDELYADVLRYRKALSLYK
jgi:hypothetical protein